MKKKTIAISIIISILLIGIVSAGLIDYFGRITGSVEVSAPVFYLDGHWGGAYYNLFVNEIPEDELEVYLSDGDRIIFKTPPLNIDYLYKTKFDFIFYAKTVPSENEIQIRISKIDPNNQLTFICESDSIKITASESFSDYKLSCIFQQEEIDFDKDQGLVLEVLGLSENETDQYWISTGKEYTNGYSRVEVEYIE